MLHFWGNSEPEIDVDNEPPTTQCNPLEEEANKLIIYQPDVNASIDEELYDLPPVCTFVKELVDEYMENMYIAEVVK